MYKFKLLIKRVCCAANKKRYKIEKQSVWKRVYYCIVHVFVWFLCVYGIERGMVVGVLFHLKCPTICVSENGTA